MNKKKNRIYNIKKLTLPKWLFKLFLLKENIKKLFKSLSYSKTYHGKWYEFTTGWSVFALSYKEAGFDTDSLAYIHISIIWGSLFIYTSQKYKKYNGNYDQEERTWGISYYKYDHSIYLQYGKKYKFIPMPWVYRFYNRSILLKDNMWIQKLDKNIDIYDDKWNKLKYKEIHQYTYKLKNGKIQKTIATIGVYEMEWRMKFLYWTKLFNKKHKYIDINFDKEIGERTGTWKGGVVGTSFKMLDNETPLQTLKRMERNKKFN